VPGDWRIVFASLSPSLIAVMSVFEHPLKAQNFVRVPIAVAFVAWLEGVDSDVNDALRAVEERASDGDAEAVSSTSRAFS